MSFKLLKPLIVALVVFTFGSASFAAERIVLSAEGAAFSSIKVTPVSVTLELQVDLQGDTPIATHVSAHPAGGGALMRTNLGYWVPWDGSLASLSDTHAPIANGIARFKLFNQEDMSSELFPIRITLSYRTESSFKFGVVELVEAE